MVIKDVLREELGRSKQLKKRYEQELKKLPPGSLVKKELNGKEYYYVAVREGKKVTFRYYGKEVSKKEIEKYNRAKKLRAQYRHLLSKTKKQIKYLKGALRGKEEI